MQDTPRIKPSFRMSKFKRASSSSKTISSAYRSPLLNGSPLNKRSPEHSGQKRLCLSNVGHFDSPGETPHNDCDSFQSPGSLYVSNSSLKKVCSSFKSPVVKGTSLAESKICNKKDYLSATSVENMKEEMKQLLQRYEVIRKEINELKKRGCKTVHLNWHIDKLHEYNDIKDVAQMVMGRIAVAEKITIRKVHEEFGFGNGD